MGKDRFGSFLQEANTELYGSAVNQLEFKEMEQYPIRLEWALDGDTLKVHLFRDPRWKWPFEYARTIYALLDELAEGEERDVGYEDLVDSWYVISKNYGSGKLGAGKSAEFLCQQLLKRLAS